MVFIRKTAAGPAHDGYVQLAQCSDDVVAEAAYVRNRGVFTDPDSFLDASTQVFRKLSVNMAVDFGARPVGMDDAGGGQIRGAHARERCQHNHGRTSQQNQSHAQSSLLQQGK
jgi:hypothetical protein